jgi:hypothetical protein
MDNTRYNVNGHKTVKHNNLSINVHNLLIYRHISANYSVYSSCTLSQYKFNLCVIFFPTFPAVGAGCCLLLYMYTNYGTPLIVQYNIIIQCYDIMYSNITHRTPLIENLFIHSIKCSVNGRLRTALMRSDTSNNYYICP